VTSAVKGVSTVAALSNARAHVPAAVVCDKLATCTRHPHKGEVMTALAGPRPINTPDQMATARESVTPRWRTNNGKKGLEK
jgi:hypothetical protein